METFKGIMISVYCDQPRIINLEYLNMPQSLKNFGNGIYFLTFEFAVKFSKFKNIMYDRIRISKNIS